MTISLRGFSFDRIEAGVKKVRRRLLRAAKALDEGGVDYAIAGGNAIAAWVSQVDEAAVRNTRDVDILIRRSDLARVTKTLEDVGFVYRHAASVDMFLDGPDAYVRESIHLIFAGEKVREHEIAPNPDVTEVVLAENYTILSLDALVRIKLTDYRDKDRTHLRDLIDVGLNDQTWVARFPQELGARLQMLIDTPEG